MSAMRLLLSQDRQRVVPAILGETLLPAGKVDEANWQQLAPPSTVATTEPSAITNLIGGKRWPFPKQ